MKNKKLLKLIQTAILCALAVVFMLVIRFSILPAASFLEYDLGDIPVILALLLIGPASGYAVLLSVAAIQALTVSAASSWEGFVMHFISTGLFLLILHLFTSGHKSNAKKMTLGLIAASITMIIAMIPLNLIFTPLYLGCPVSAVKELLLPAIIPFNAIKAVINSVMVSILFPVIRGILSRSHLLAV